MWFGLSSNPGQQRRCCGPSTPPLSGTRTFVSARPATSLDRRRSIIETRDRYNRHG
jgi:hypothetical protein